MKTGHLILILLLFANTVKMYGQTPGFDPRVRLISDTAASDVQVADIDGDGKTDIIATNPALHILMVFLNKSAAGKIDTNSFAAPLIYPTGPQPGIVAIDDMDGDGKPDIVLINIGYSPGLNGNNSLTLFHNVSIPGKIKLSAVPIINSTATAQAIYHFQLKTGDNIARITDLDEDGKPDITVLNTAGFISIYLNEYSSGQPLKNILGSSVIIPLPLHPNSFTIGDMDGDGKQDVITTNHDSASVSILLNTPAMGVITSSSFQHIDLPLKYHPITVSLGDMDGDGKPDAVVGTPDHKTITLIHNESTPGHFNGTVISLSKLDIASNYNDDIIIQDLNGDGKPDLLSLNADCDSVYLYTNKSVPSQTSTDYFKKKINCPVITIPDRIADLDGDGSLDMIIGSSFGIDVYHGKSSSVQTSLLQQANSEVSDDDMIIYPNPASLSTNVKYHLPAQSDVLVSVYTEDGKLLQSFKTGELAAGTHINAIETCSLKTGVYIITITANNYNKAGKLMIK